jgi:Lon protease-like protein
MTPLERVERASSSLKVFPLPSMVLFPNLVAPLHIFEPRYRDLIRDALEGDRVMAMAQLQPGWETAYLERPAMEPIVCAGVIAWHEAQPDGRYNILLQGLVRARLEEELKPEKSYRVIRAQVLPDPAYHGPEEEELRQAVLELSTGLPPPIAESLLQLAARSSGGALADVVAGTVVQDVSRRQELLAVLDPRERLNQTLNELSELIVRMPPLRPDGPLH